MTEAKSSLKWKRALGRAWKVYAGFCTVMVTAYFAVLIWNAASSESEFQTNGTMVMASYGEYVAKEHPKRGEYFLRLATTLGMHSKKTAVPAADTLKYLGKPDLIAGTPETGTLVYLHDHPEATNKWAIYASLKEGTLMEIGFNDSAVNDHSGYQHYVTP